MKKRILPLLAMLFIVSQLLIACGGDGTNPSDTTAAPSTAAPDTTPAETEAPPEWTNPGVNYNGETITFLDHQVSSPSWTFAKYGDIHAVEITGELINDEQYKRNMKVESELGVKIETIAAADQSDRSKLYTVLQKDIDAAENTIDVAMLYGSQKNFYTEVQYFTDLRSIETLDLSHSWWDADANEVYSLHNAQYVATGDINLYTQAAPIVMFFQKEMAVDHGLGNLYDLVRDGSWTWDKLIELGTQVSGDANGDTILDENDRYGLASQHSMMARMLGSCAIRFVSKDGEDNMKVTVNTEKTATAIEKFVKLLNNANIVSNANDERYKAKYKNVFNQMHIPMFANKQILFNHNQLLITFELREAGADFGILPTPKYDEKQDEYWTPVSSSWMRFVMVPSTNDKLEMTGHVLDAMGYYSQQYVTPAFIDTTVRFKSLRDEDSAEMLDLCLNTKRYEPTEAYNWGRMYNMINNLSTNNDTNFVSGYKAIESAVEEALAKYVESLVLG